MPLSGSESQQEKPVFPQFSLVFMPKVPVFAGFSGFLGSKTCPEPLRMRVRAGRAE
jgi:hypothetical protein